MWELCSSSSSFPNRSSGREPRCWRSWCGSVENAWRRDGGVFADESAWEIFGDEVGRHGFFFFYVVDSL